MKKNLKLLIVVLVYIAFTILTWFFTKDMYGGYQPFNITFTGDFSLDTLILTYGMMLTPLLSIFLGAYVLVPIIITFHIKRNGKKGKYFIYSEFQKKSFNDYFNKIKFPMLLTINLGLILSALPVMHDILITPAAQASEGFTFNQINVITFLFPVISFLGVLLFVPLYLLEDTGIFYSEVVKKENNPIIASTSPMVENYSQLIEGYTGISVIVGLFTLVFDIYSILSGSGEGGGIAQFLSSWLTMPISIGLLLIPSVILLNTQYSKFMEFTLNFIRKKIEILPGKLEIVAS
ncbi:MAG: hypothetical protein ACFFCS_20665 [Candidatus Hodarchaeota archaeon]